MSKLSFESYDDRRKIRLQKFYRSIFYSKDKWNIIKTIKSILRILQLQNPECNKKMLKNEAKFIIRTAKNVLMQIFYPDLYDFIYN